MGSLVCFFRIVVNSSEELSSSDEGGSSEGHANATSSEILADVLEQLKKLGPEKRNIVLDKLKVDGLIKHSDGGQKQSSTSIKSTVASHVEKQLESEDNQGEVEILDLDEPKMGTYKRKRSECCNASHFDFFFQPLII